MDVKECQKVFQLGSIACLVFVLSACGGSGGGGSSSGSVTEGAPIPENSSERIISSVTADNYLELAEMAWSRAVSASDVPAAPVEIEGVRTQSLVSMALAPVNCDSGSGTDDLFFESPPKITDGDRYESIYDNCKRNIGGGGYSLSDGNVKTDFKLEGDYLGGNEGAYNANVLYEKWLLEFKYSSEPSFSIMLDGDIVYDAERVGTLARWSQKIERLYMESKDDGVVTWTALMTDSFSEWKDDFSNNTYSLVGKHDLVLGSELWFLLDFKMVLDLTGSLDQYGDREAPIAGFITLSDNTSNAIVTVKPNGNSAVIELDLDGDGISEQSQTLSIEDSLLKK